MKMAKASEEEMERSITLSNILMDVDDGQYPRCVDGQFNEDDPDYFDPDDRDHLRAFYDRMMAVHAGIHRVTWGFHTLMHNDIIDPDKSHLDLHPRLLKALETEKVSTDLLDAAVLALADLQQLHRHHYPGCEGGCPADGAIKALEAAIPKAKAMESMNEEDNSDVSIL